MTEIYIISGFLGAGKTTLIQKMLKESFCNKKIALVENDFGDISVDAALLSAGGYKVLEMKSGCICCTLTGDFIKSLCNMIKEFTPDVVIIEPSGVGKLSDIETACKKACKSMDACIKRKITVVDVMNCEKYYENFGEFFDNQISCADTVVFSHSDESASKLENTISIVKKLNDGAIILTSCWNEISSDELIGNQHECNCEHEHHHHECNGEHEHEHHHDCDCDHEHSAEDAFDTLTLTFLKKIDITEIKSVMLKICNSECGMVLRMKGIVRSEQGFVSVQFIPNKISIEKTEATGNELCIIGKQLCTEKIRKAFAEFR